MEGEVKLERKGPERWERMSFNGTIVEGEGERDGTGRRTRRYRSEERGGKSGEARGGNKPDGTKARHRLVQETGERPLHIPLQARRPRHTHTYTDTHTHTHTHTYLGVS